MCRTTIILLALAAAAFPVAGQQQASTRNRHTATASAGAPRHGHTQPSRSSASARTSPTAPLRGSLSNLERQDRRLKDEELEPIEDNRDLAARIANHLLVSLPVSAALTVNPELPADRRYSRPWTAKYLAALARDHEAAFHRPLEISSAVRTVAYQKRLKRTNSNAAPAEGAVFSPHVMGATVDIAKREMSRAEILWLRRRLRADSAAGRIDVEEEFEQACFHITVYKPAAPAPGAQARVQSPVAGSHSQTAMANAAKGAESKGSGIRDQGSARRATTSRGSANQAHMDLLF